MTEPTPMDQVAFTPTLADTLAAYRLHTLRPRRIAIYALLYGAILAGIGAIFHKTPNGLALAFAAGFLLICLFCALWIAVLLPFRVRRVYRQQANLRVEHAMTWSEAGLSFQSQRGNGTVPWTDYIGRKENTALLLLYHSDTLFQFIPKRVLGPAQTATLRPFLDQLPVKR